MSFFSLQMADLIGVKVSTKKLSETMCCYCYELTNNGTEPLDHPGINFFGTLDHATPNLRDECKGDKWIKDPSADAPRTPPNPRPPTPPPEGASYTEIFTTKTLKKGEKATICIVAPCNSTLTDISVEYFNTEGQSIVDHWIREEFPPLAMIQPVRSRDLLLASIRADLSSAELLNEREIVSSLRRLTRNLALAQKKERLALVGELRGEKAIRRGRGRKKGEIYG